MKIEPVFLEKLRAYFEKHPGEQARVARALGVSRAWMSKVVSGEIKSSQHVRALSRETGVAPPQQGALDDINERISARVENLRAVEKHHDRVFGLLNRFDNIRREFETIVKRQGAIDDKIEELIKEKRANWDRLTKLEGILDTVESQSEHVRRDALATVIAKTGHQALEHAVEAIKSPPPALPPAGSSPKTVKR